MTVSDLDIIREYERRETDAGGARNADQKAVLRETAEALGVTYERARDAILWAWGTGC